MLSFGIKCSVRVLICAVNYIVHENDSYSALIIYGEAV